MRKVKTDIIDAHHLCELYYKKDLEPYKKRGIQIANLRNLTRQHDNITGMYVQTKLQFQAVLDQVFPEYTKVFGDLYSDVSLKILRAFPTSEAIFNKAYDLATILSEKHDYIVIGESLAAGTTTALGVLVGLGYDAKGKVSGCMDTNPHSLKNRLVDEGLANANLTPNKDNDPFEVVAAVGDAMLPAVAGVIMGATVPVVLAGGTQLTAACAIVRAIDKDFDFSNTCLSTTAYVVADETADLLDIAKQIGGITVNAVDPFFEDSTVEGLKNYTKGFIKEGAGAGGAMFLALMRGHSIESIRTAIEKEALK